MAKGNDGNFLQHCIEVEAASRLTEMDTRGRLHIALTHGMAPFEPLDQPKSDVCREILKHNLAASKKTSQNDELAIVKAYRETNASWECYPNSAELLRSVVGTDRISGGITETKHKKHKKLFDKWSGSNVRTACCSWRSQVVPGGILTCPDNLEIPWLFTMDPMTYRETGWADDDRIHRFDIDILPSALIQYIGSGQPGIAVLFVYNVMPEDRYQFWKFMDDLAKKVGVDTCSFWLPHLGRSRNLAGVLDSGINLLSDFRPCGLRIGRE